MAKDLFTIPIHPIDKHPGGTVICQEPSPRIYLLTFTSPNDNRITLPFIEAILEALDLIEGRLPPGVVVTTSGIPKFYSNGLDLALASATPRFFEHHLYRLLSRFLTYPMPTVALVNGHAFAGGFFWAMHHDYRVFSGGDRGFMCVNELEFGAPIPVALDNIFIAKATPNVYRDTVLEARRWNGPAALQAGLVDAVGGWDAVEGLVRQRDLTKMGTTGVYRPLKTGMYREQLALLSAGGDDLASLHRRLHDEKVKKKQVQKKTADAKL